jgi:hypothetical protein
MDKILGKLRSMTLAIPGGRGLFSLLQSGLKHRDKRCIHITMAIGAELKDFKHLTGDHGGSRPISLFEIFPDLLVALGASDAAISCMCGVWFSAMAHSRTFKPPSSPSSTHTVPSPILTWNWVVPLRTKISLSKKWTALGMQHHYRLLRQHYC